MRYLTISEHNRIASTVDLNASYYAYLSCTSMLPDANRQAKSEKKETPLCLRNMAHSKILSENSRTKVMILKRIIVDKSRVIIPREESDDEE